MTDKLTELLQSKFGFSEFRPYQEEVCRSAMAGDDALLVMPTGAGKSLCYQLPGLAMQGTTLVISPLIALMEDQVIKMQQKGLRAERIHAGRDRADSRRVCFEYLEGKLDYLYIAPERLGVPNFPQMLAKRKPALIAIDEAHCISHWGHDFRPDYRRLSERLELLKPTPILAVTATATKLVQDDIVKQLGLKNAHRFIHGFRRKNIAIELVEMPPSERQEKVLTLLQEEERRPAIVYSPTRKHCESIASFLRSKIPAAAYHAGLPASARDSVQQKFLEGKIDVIVATVAFGMGIDKANVRTIIHTALPGSIEAYYQEIGRAGRDGIMSRAVLMHSYGDRRTHEFFQERDYPDTQALKRIFRATTKKAVPKDDLREEVKLPPDVFDVALEKLWIHQGVEVDFSENVARGKDGWETAYEAQRKHKTLQLDQLNEFTRAKGCRMQHLIQHFGDTEGTVCGLCDYCAQDACWLKSFRKPTADETKIMENLYGILAQRDGVTVGQLHTRASDGSLMDRTSFDFLLDGLARADFVRLATDSFEKDGSVIQFQRVYLTIKGKKFRGFPSSDLSIAKHTESKATKKKRAKAEKVSAQQTTGPLAGADLDVFKKLRDWRLEEARKFKVPAFCILSDRVMRSIAVARPETEDDLVQIKGIGPKLLEKHGKMILSTLKDGA